jgi:hypothetical protein
MRTQNIVFFISGYLKMRLKKAIPNLLWVGKLLSPISLR